MMSERTKKILEKEKAYLEKKKNKNSLTNNVRYIKLIVTYDGSAFFGYQYQPDVPTVQGELERAFKLITRGEESRAVGAGRTDAGVHAIFRRPAIHEWSGVCGSPHFLPFCAGNHGRSRPCQVGAAGGYTAVDCAVVGT